MTITALMDPSKLPNQLQDQTTFDANFAYLLENLLLRGQQENALAANLNSIAYGGAYAYPYLLDTTTTADGDPGAGKIRFNQSADQSSSSFLYLDDSHSGGANISGLLDGLSASTSAVKGKLRMVMKGDPTKYLTFNVTGVTAATGYRKVAVSGPWGASPSPFANGDTVLLHFERTGDKGDPGIYSYLKVSDRKANGVVGGAAVTGWQTRTLNTIELNTIEGAALSSNMVTLPAGTYDVAGRAPGAQNTHKVALYNVTDAAYAVLGSSASPASSACIDSVLTGRITITATKTFQLRHFISDSSTFTGQLGNAVASGLVEVYSEIEFRKVA